MTSFKDINKTGIRRMRETVAAAGLPPPKISQTTFFTITFKRPMLRDSADIGLSKESVGKRIKGVENLAQGSEKLSEKMSEKTPERIFSALIGHPEATIAHLSAALGVSNRTIERNLKRLQDQGRIRRVGPDRGGHWEIVNVKTEA